MQTRGSACISSAEAGVGRVPRGKVLLVVHQRHSYPGRVGRLLMEAGYALDVRCPCLGQALPRDLSHYALVGVFGGPMSANDCHMDGIRAELDWLPLVLESDRPFLGICLGAQLLARVLGAPIAPHPEGRVEIGYTEVRPTDHGAGYFDGPMMVYQWHREGFGVSSDSVLLAEGETFPNQAFRWGDRAYGLQFHPEVTREMMERWTTMAAHRLVLPGAQPAEEQFACHPRFDPALDSWIGRFLAQLLAKAGHPAQSQGLLTA